VISIAGSDLYYLAGGDLYYCTLLVVISTTLLVVISLVKQTAMLKRIITTTFTAKIGLILSTPFVSFAFWLY
jgi:hypothetical protein